MRHTRKAVANLVLRSLIDEAEGQIWSSKKIQRISRVLSPVHAMACAIHSDLFTEVLQIYIFTEEVVFRLDIQLVRLCLSYLLRLFKTLSRYQ